MSPSLCNPRAERCARALADAVAAVGAELRLVDVADYIAYIRNDHLASLQDIVSSSVELYFKPGTLTFGWAAGFELDWARLPTITLGMEFRHRDAWIVFDLILEAEKTGVDVRHAVVSGANGTPADDMDRLIAAIADARLPDPRDRRAP